MPKIIGIGGCSRSGKSSLAHHIKEKLADKRVLLLDMDAFVHPASEIPKIRDRTDWERPESVDFERLIQAIKDSKDYDTIVVEGILIFANETLRKLFDTTIHVEISKDTFLARRRLETRWGDEPEWFLEHVWKSYLRHGQFPEADFVLSGKAPTSMPVISEILERC
ncbi:MAG: hypothetical protein ABJG47_09040 [Ekhidna sp.]